MNLTSGTLLGDFPCLEHSIKSAFDINVIDYMHQLLLGPSNTVTTCIFCHASIKTVVNYTSTTRTHIAAALWCLAGCMCCMPYGSESARNADHYCPKCQRYLGTYQT